MEENIDPKEYGVTQQLFKEWRSPRFGNSNPQKIESPVWEWLVRSKLCGYLSTQKMDGPSPFDEGPTWSFDRFGQTKTQLPDGRTVYIGGEHEDHYDPDFYIYNDVIVEHPNGEFDFYCYPKTDFPPSDFHTATLIGSKIVLIGSLGYPQERVEASTQLYLLDLNDFKISPINSSGKSPGWIHRHEAILDTSQTSITVTKGFIEIGLDSPLRENIDDWKLDIENWTWQRLTERKWPRWELTRKDKARNHIYDIRQALWSNEVNWEEHHQQDMARLEESMGFSVDFNLVKALYDFDFTHESLVEDEEEHNVYWIYVDGVRVRFVEERYCLNVTVEGSLGNQTLTSMREQLISSLNELEISEWTINEY
ncbi:hypothetical protein EZV61_19300 [Corallincola luteus]|uniref:Uncharacterized protein n=2 Tax=Corallincola luteus TaxID=1775177 RepID=A0ABY2AFB2_9GAMM|nr:hypothetical protein EZV61_19300 [Corallincola luteus]